MAFSPCMEKSLSNAQITASLSRLREPRSLPAGLPGAAARGQVIATEAHGPLECYRDFRARQANRFAERPEFCDRYARDRTKPCQAQAVGRFPAESYSLPILSLPLQPLRTDSDPQPTSRYRHH